MFIHSHIWEEISNLVFCASSDDRKWRNVELFYYICLMSRQVVLLEGITTMFLCPPRFSSNYADDVSESLWDILKVRREIKEVPLMEFAE